MVYCDNDILNIIYGYYVKYDRLIPLINAEFAGSGIECINIMIDVRDIYRKVKSNELIFNNPVNNPLCIISGIINMVAHYRNFFQSSYGVKSRFVLVCGAEYQCINSKKCSEYKYPAIPIIRNTTLIEYGNMVDMLKLLCGYIPNIDVVYSSSFTFTDIAYMLHYNLLHKTNQKIPTFIISKDRSTLQLSATDIFIYNIIPSKSINHGDTSLLVHGTSSVETYLRTISKADLTNYILYPYKMSLLMSICGCSYVGYSSLCPVKPIVKALDVLVKSQHITPGHDIRNIYDIVILINRTINKSIDPYQVEFRVNAIDIINQLGVLMVAPEFTIPLKIEDSDFLYDPESVKKITSEYFSTCPLDINVL